MALLMTEAYRILGLDMDAQPTHIAAITKDLLTIEDHSIDDPPARFAKKALIITAYKTACVRVRMHGGEIDENLFDKPKRGSDRMPIMDLQRHLEIFGRAIRPQMNMSIYHGNFECACGRQHEFHEYMDLICEGSMRVLAVCPEDTDYVTTIKIKTFMVFKFLGFESLAGTHLRTIEDHAIINQIRRVVR